VASDGDQSEAARRALRVQALLKEALAEQRRGNHKTAQTKAEDAIALAPESADAHEVLGDIHVASGHFARAKEAYQHALSLAPGRTETEEKLARASLGQLRFDRQLEQGRKLLEGKGTHKDMRRATSLATMASFLWPGGGQILNGQYAKGAVMAFAHLLLVLLMVNMVTEAIRDAKNERIVTVYESPYAQRRPQGLRGVRHAADAVRSQGKAGILWMLAVLDLALYGWSVMDAMVGAQRREEDEYV